MSFFFVPLLYTFVKDKNNYCPLNPTVKPVIMNILKKLKLLLSIFLSFSILSPTNAHTTQTSFLIPQFIFNYIVKSSTAKSLDTEICDNGIDDDNDGLVDVFDEDCQCTVDISTTNLVPNGNFEDRNGCCEEIGDQDENCLNNWIHLNSTPDYIHSDCTQSSIPILEEFYGVPIDNGFMTNYIYHLHSTTGKVTAESVGVCLTETLLAGNTYRISLDIGLVRDSNNPLDENAYFTINGIPECDSLSNYRTEYNFFDNEHFCDLGLPYEALISVNLFSLNPGWNTATVNFTPNTNLEAIFINGDCNHITQDGQNPKAFFDNVSIQEIESLTIDEEIDVIGDPCSTALRFSVEDLPNVTYQWYRDFIALPTATNHFIGFNPSLQEVTGTYHVFVTFPNGDCQLIGPHIYEAPDAIASQTAVFLCQNHSYEFGAETISFPTSTSMQTFTAANGCDSTVTLNITYVELPSVTLFETINEGETYIFYDEILSEAGVYTNTVQVTNGCDSLITLNLDIINAEICDNGIDDDGDGLVDVFDEDCQCIATIDSMNLVPNSDFREKDGCCGNIDMPEDMCVADWIMLKISPDYNNADCFPFPLDSIFGVSLENPFFGAQFHYSSSLSSESIGVCLEAPVSAGQTYIVSLDLGLSNITELDDDMFFTINGIADCDNLPNYVTNDEFCDSNLPYEKLISTNLFTLNTGWNTLEFEITPSTNIEAIFISGDCDYQPANTPLTVYTLFKDITIYKKRDRLEIPEITSNGFPCQGDFSLTTANLTNATYQWYKDSVAITGANTNNLVFGTNEEIEGLYQVFITDENGDCQLSPPFEVELTELVSQESITLCQNETYEFGTEIVTFPTNQATQTFITANGCDSIVTLSIAYTGTSNFSFSETINQGDTYVFNDENLMMSGMYMDTLENTTGCDSIITLTLMVIDDNVEICDNGIDDDGDGLIDAFDPDCQCTAAIDTMNLVPNSDFEAHDGCCLFIADSTTNCIHDWVVTGPTPDYYHPDCSTGEEDFGVPIDQGFLGLGFNYTSGTTIAESMGVCLNAPMETTATYSISIDIGRKFPEPDEITEDAFFTFNGISDCDNLSDYNLIADDFCDGTLSYETLFSINLFTLVPGWNTFEFEVCPNTNIEAIFLGGECDYASATFQSAYLIFDNIIIKKKSEKLSEVNILTVGTPCEGTLDFMVEDVNNATYQWYRDSMVIVGATDHVLSFETTDQVVEGIYQVLVTYEDGSCVLSAPLDYQLPTETSSESIVLCEGETFPFGNIIIDEAGEYIDTFMMTSGACDSIVTLTVSYESHSEYSFSESINEGDTYVFNDENLTMSGVYMDTLENATGCDSILTLTLTIIGDDTEICDNGIDDDGDGLIDFMDEDCQCNTVTNFVPNGDFESIDSCCIFIQDNSDNCLNNWVVLGTSPDYINPDCIEDTEFQEEFYGVPIEDGFLGVILNYLNGQFSAEAMGVCLNESLETGTSYTISIDVGRIFTSPNDGVTEDVFLTINGISNCNNLNNYNLENGFCDSGLPYEELASINLFTLNPGWNTFEIEFTPTSDIEAIFISGDCDLQTTNPQNPYAFFDNIHIQETGVELLEDEIVLTGNACNGTLFFTVENNPMATYQWYKDTILIPDATTNTLALSANQSDIAGAYSVYVTFENGQCQLIGPLDYELPEISEEISIEICEGESYDFYGTILTQEGVYQDTLINVGNCISISTLNLTILPSTETLIEAEICEGDSYDFNGEILTQEGIYLDTLNNAIGCDSIISLHLTLIPASEFEFFVTICQGDSYDFGGETLTNSGIYQDTLNNVLGCDSIVNLNLNLGTFFESTVVENICEGDSYEFGGDTLHVAGIYKDTLLSPTGCDSIITLDLMVHMPVIFSFDVEICEGDSYDFNGEILSEAGTFQQHLIADNGCDSILSLNLILIPASEAALEIEVCAGEIYTFGDTTITDSGIYQQTFSTIDNNCDSLVILTINFLETLQGDTLYIEQEEGTTYAFHGTTYDMAGTYEATLSSTNGCDSLVYLDLRFVGLCANALDMMIETANSACEIATNGWIDIIVDGGKSPYQYSIDGGTNFVSTSLFENLSAGDYDIMVVDNNGCDATDQISIESNSTDLLVQLPNDTTIMSGTPLDIAIVDINFEAVSYEWTSGGFINCPTCEVVQLIDNTSGLHTLTATDENGCMASDDIFVNITKRPEIYIPNAFSPDGDEYNDFFELGIIPELVERIEEMSIFDRWGNLVYHQENLDQETLLQWDGMYQNKKAVNGVYVYMITWRNMSEESETLRGEVTLIR